MTIRLAVNEMTTFRWTFDEDVHHCVEQGVSALGVWRQKLSDYGEEKGVELLREADLAVSSLLWGGGFTGSDGRSHKESITDAVQAIRVARDLHAGCLVVYTGARAGHTHNHARRLVKNALKELLPVAEDHRVVMALEPMHEGCAAEWTFLTQLDDAVRLVDEFSNPHLKLVFDTYHWGWNDNLLDDLPSLIDHIALVQLGDAKKPPSGEQNRCRLGDGMVPLAEIMSRLSASGYGGFYELELLGEDVEPIDYRELIRHSKATLESLLERKPAN